MDARTDRFGSWAFQKAPGKAFKEIQYKSEQKSIIKFYYMGIFSRVARSRLYSHHLV